MSLTYPHLLGQELTFSGTTIADSRPSRRLEEQSWPAVGLGLIQPKIPDKSD
jgi:hypothetical protein